MKAKNVRLVLLVLTAALGFAGPVAAQKSGGVLRIQHMDTPPSASIHEEATVSVAVPFMSLYNNLVMFDQHAPKNSLETVVPDLATKWEWKVNLSGVAVDDPDVAFRELRLRLAAQLQQLLRCGDDQAVPGPVARTRSKKRQQMVWDIDHKLQAEIARPIIYYGRAAGCWQPQVKNVTLHINSIYNNWRFEDVWLER